MSRSTSRTASTRQNLGDTPEFPVDQRAACYDLVKSMFGLKNRNGRVISPPFEDLPLREGNDHYYRNIPDPRSMRMVLERLTQGFYVTPRDLYVDLKLCFSSWSFISSRSSRDWQDTVKMDQTVDERWEVQAKEGNLPSVDDMFPDEPSTGPLDAGVRSASPETPANEASAPPPAADPVTTASPAPIGPTPTPVPEPAASAQTPAAASPAPPASAAAPAPASLTAAAKRERAGSHSSELSNVQGGGRPAKKPRHESAVNEDGTPVNPPPMGSAYATTPLLDRPRIPDTGSPWMVAPPEGSETTMDAVMQSILTALRDERDYALSGGTGMPLLARLPELQRLPDRSSNPLYYQKVKDPVSLEMIDMRLRNNAYTDAADFDRDLYSVFRSAQVHFRDDPVRLGAVFLLQRLYQELTKGDGRKHQRSQSQAALASVQSGPGTTSAATANSGAVQAAGSTAAKVRPSEQVLLQEIRYKDNTFRVGDFVHLMNPDDCTKPIIGQIFKLWKDPTSADRHVHVCWYYRPEQTVHIPSRRFIENEVFRAYSFVDHAIEDVLERCLVMFHTRFLRGRPKAPYWTPTMPTYICEHRYKEDAKSFKKIKNWTSCIPVELRDQDEDANFTFYPSPLASTTLKRVPSPFLRGEKGPGGVGNNETMDKEQWKYHATDGPGTPSFGAGGQRDVRPMPQRDGSGTQGGSSQGRSGGQTDQGKIDPLKMVRLVKEMTSMPELAAKQEQFDKLPESLSKHFRKDPQTGDVLWFAAPPLRLAPTEPVYNSLAYLHFVADKPATPPPPPAPSQRVERAMLDSPAGSVVDDSPRKQVRILNELLVQTSQGRPRP